MTYKELKTEYRDKIIYTITNKENNEELLKKVPYKEYMDFIVVFYLHMTDLSKENEVSVSMIDKKMQKEWGISTEELFELAMENTPRILGLKIQGIFSTIAQYVTDSEICNIAEMEDNSVPLYVATNNYATKGAAVILYKDMLRAFAARMKCNLFVIPASVHEVILVKIIDGMLFDVDTIKEMIWNINRTEVAARDVLSDSLYFYDRSTDTLSIA